MQRKIALFTLSSCLVLAAGYRIPEQSVSAVALGAANVANASGADASYYNPANMVFGIHDRQLEASLSVISLEKTEFVGTVGGTGPYDIASKSETIAMPGFHYAVKANDRLSYGFSLVVPGGLTKRWDESPAKTYAEEFTLENVELNPSIGYKLSDTLAIGGGVRVIQSSGVVKSRGTVPVTHPLLGTLGYTEIARDMEGDGTFFGYNLAVAYRPVENLSLAATYRSNVDLKEEGDAKLTRSEYTLLQDIPGSPTIPAGTTMPGASHSSGASVTVPLPATLVLAAAYSFGDTTVELAYDKTMWSEYEDLDFKYDSTVSDAVLVAAFDDPKEKNWKDAVAYRLGVTHALNEKTRLMAGYVKDETPVPESTLGFELPDADADVFSVGFWREVSPNLSAGAAYLQSRKKSRTVTNDDMDGKFTGSTIHFVTVGMGYVF